MLWIRLHLLILIISLSSCYCWSHCYYSITTSSYFISSFVFTMTAQIKAKSRNHDHDKLKLWVMKLTDINNYWTWKNQMKNFLRTKKKLLKLMKNESAESTTLIISNTFKDDQLAFEDYFWAELQCLSSIWELDMWFKIYQQSWKRYETEIKTHAEQNQSACNYLYQSMNKICWSQILRIDNMKRIWDKLNILYKMIDISSIIDLHHQLATVKFNLRNSNVYTERIKKIVNKIKKLNENSQDFINIL